jgi:type II secretory pathway pseudopilin PulG
MTLVELVVTMAVVLVISVVVLTLYGAFSSTAADSRALSVSQERVHTVMRVLEADVRSANPLLLVPSSFTLDPTAVTSSGASGTTPTDVIAMYETTDSFSPCTHRVSNPSGTVPSPFLPSAVGANVIWAYNPGAHTLTRYSYCAADTSPAWKQSLVLFNVVNAKGTMFTISQNGASVVGTQTQTPTTTTVTNQAAPVCGTSLTISVRTKARTQVIPYAVQLAVALPNETGVEAQAC